MLTSTYYYDAYKPYFVKDYNDNQKEVKTKTTKLSYSPTYFLDKTFMLNKALKNNTIKYISDLSTNVLGLSQTSKEFLKDYSNYQKSFYGRNSTYSKNMIRQDMVDFADEFNETLEFALSNDTSKEIKQLGLKMQQLGLKMQQLAESNIQKNNVNEEFFYFEDNKIYFNSEMMDKMETKKIQEKLKSINQFVGTISEETNNVLKSPISSHMEFKGLNYYYNYKLGTIKDNTFAILQTGMLVDIAL